MKENIKEIQFEKCLVRIHIPDLTEEEKEIQRENHIISTRKFLCEVEKRRKRGRRNDG